MPTQLARSLVPLALSTLAVILRPLWAEPASPPTALPQGWTETMRLEDPNRGDGLTLEQLKAIPTIPPTPALEATGYYFLTAQQAASFPELKWIELHYTADPKGQESALVGVLRLKHRSSDGRYVELDLHPILSAPDRLRFETESRDGVSYSFSGRFLRMGVLSEVATADEVVLRGILERFRNGQAERAVEVSFTYFEGD
jgi:hypothetical protein